MALICLKDRRSTPSLSNDRTRAPFNLLTLSHKHLQSEFFENPLPLTRKFIRKDFNPSYLLPPNIQRKVRKLVKLLFFLCSLRADNIPYRLATFSCYFPLPLLWSGVYV